MGKEERTLISYKKKNTTLLRMIETEIRKEREETEAGV